MEDRIRSVMAAVFEISVDDITDELSSDNFELWDSLNHLKLIVALEEEFDIIFDDDDIIIMLTFGLIVIIVKGKLERDTD